MNSPEIDNAFYEVVSQEQIKDLQDSGAKSKLAQHEIDSVYEGLGVMRNLVSDRLNSFGFKGIEPFGRLLYSYQINADSLSAEDAQGVQECFEHPVIRRALIEAKPGVPTGDSSLEQEIQITVNDMYELPRYEQDGDSVISVYSRYFDCSPSNSVIFREGMEVYRNDEPLAAIDSGMINEGAEKVIKKSVIDLILNYENTVSLVPVIKKIDARSDIELDAFSSLIANSVLDDAPFDGLSMASAILAETEGLKPQEILHYDI